MDRDLLYVHNNILHDCTNQLKCLRNSSRPNICSIANSENYVNQPDSSPILYELKCLENSPIRSTNANSENSVYKPDSSPIIFNDDIIINENRNSLREPNYSSPVRQQGNLQNVSKTKRTLQFHDEKEDSQHSDNSDSEPVELAEDSGDEYVPDSGSESSEEETPPNIKEDIKNLASKSLASSQQVPTEIQNTLDGIPGVSTAVEPRKRRRKATPKMWIRNVRKRLRQSGQEYTNHCGRVVGKKTPRSVNCAKCRFHCNDNFSEEHRQKLLDEYYNLADVNKQRMYISNCVVAQHVQRPKENARKHRNISRAFYLINAEGDTVRVCLKFFCATFAVSSKFVCYTMQNVSPISNVHVNGDMRSGKTPHNITPPEDVQFVKDHIDSFPRVPSHYCRKDTKREYLGSELKITTMYTLYQAKCEEHNKKPVGLTLFRNLFAAHEPPLSFYSPRKDQCPVCNVHKQLVLDGIVSEVEIDKKNFVCDEDASFVVEEDDIDEMLHLAESDVEKFEREYKVHKQREYASLSMRDEDKERAKTDDTFRAISFDLQAILQLPYAAENQLYYIRKLNVYNFTIYDSSDRSGYCYLWDETNGKKGSNEIATCLITYLKQLPSTVNHVTSFSDTCGGQNRNRNVTAAMLYAVQTIDHINTIDLKFMESGHSFLDADSMHARIEENRQHKQIYSTREYGLIIQGARQKPKPYSVNYMKYSEFQDWKSYSTKLLQNVKFITKGSEDTKVQWLKIKWMRFEKSRPNIVQFKYNLHAPSFMEFDVRGSVNGAPKRRTRTTKNDTGSEAATALAIPKRAYSNSLPISDLKKKDLLTMLKKKIIPAEYTSFYENLPAVNNQVVEKRKKKN